MASDNCLKKQRKSGVELLKIIAIVLIVISHISQTIVKFKFNDALSTNVFMEFNSSFTFEEQIVLFTRNFGVIGNMIFFICSSFFLCENNSFRIKQTSKICFDTWLISWLVLAIYLVFDMCTRLTINELAIVKSLLPFNFNNNWFIGCYIMIIVVHPLLNCLIEKFDNKKLLFFCLFFFMIYDVYCFILNEPVFEYGVFLNYALIYLIVGLIKRNYKFIFEQPKFSYSMIIVGVVGLILTFVILGTSNCDGEIIVNANSNNNVFVVLLVLGLFAVFYRFDITSKFINYLSSLSLFIYLSHENLLFRELTRPMLFKWLCEQFHTNYLLVLLIMVLMVLFCSAVFSALYKASLGKITYKLSIVFEKKFKHFVELITSKQKTTI